MAEESERIVRPLHRSPREADDGRGGRRGADGEKTADTTVDGCKMSIKRKMKDERLKGKRSADSADAGAFLARMERWRGPALAARL